MPSSKQLLPARLGVAQRPAPRRGQQRRRPAANSQLADAALQCVMLMEGLEELQHPQVELAQLYHTLQPISRFGGVGVAVGRGRRCGVGGERGRYKLAGLAQKKARSQNRAASSMCSEAGQLLVSH